MYEMWLLVIDQRHFWNFFICFHIIKSLKFLTTQNMCNKSGNFFKKLYPKSKCIFSVECLPSRVQNCRSEMVQYMLVLQKLKPVELFL